VILPFGRFLLAACAESMTASGIVLDSPNSPSAIPIDESIGKWFTRVEDEDRNRLEGRR
jgi:hypothetical protein